MTDEEKGQVAKPFESSESNSSGSLQEQQTTPSFDVEDVPDIPLPSEGRGEKIVDECTGAVRWAFIGSGQAGTRLAESYYKLGYRRVCAINTTEQDFANVDLPKENRLVMDIGEGGAGKDQEKGKEAITQYYEDVYDLLKRSFRDEFERIILLCGSGGGTGGGSIQTLVNICNDMAESCKLEPCSVGVLTAMPMRSEGQKVNANTYNVLSYLFTQVAEQKISPLIVVDNERIGKIYPGLSVTKFWPIANKSITSLFHLFNNIAVQDSSFTTFDRADYRDLMKSGIVTFGATPLSKWESETDVSYAVRENLKKNILVTGMDLSSAQKAGCIFIGSPDVLNSIPQEHLEHGFEMLTRMMKGDSVVHRGIYTGNIEGLRVYTLLGELGVPIDRFDEIKKIGKVE